MTFDGDFETHVTVACEDDAVGALAGWARAAGVKTTHVVLARGRVRSQPMATITGSGTLDDQLAAADRLVASLASSGFPVNRVKIEAAPWTRGVPRTDDEAAALGPGYYFEHHVEVLCEAHVTDADLEQLASLVAPHHAHLSWNARRMRDDARAERFVTQRCRSVGDESAQAALAALTATLTAAHTAPAWEIVSTEREFVVYDSDLSLDAGWIAGDGDRG